MISRRVAAAVLVVFLAGVAVRLPTLSQRDPALILAHHGSDDLFYFTQMAGHLAHSGFPSIDGLHATTGVQPLFMVLLLPAAARWSDQPSTMLRTALILATLLTVVAAAVGWRVVGQNVGQDLTTPPILFAALCALHPRFLDMTFEGAEGALAAAAWLASMFAWQRDRGDVKDAVLLGFVIGFGVLGRLDHGILGVLLILRTRTGKWRSPRYGAVAAGTAALIASPWFAACWFWTGTVLPDSGAAKALHASWAAADLGGGIHARLLMAGKAVMQAGASLISAGSQVSVVTAGSLILVGGWWLTDTLSSRSSAWRVTRRLVSQLWPLFVGTILVVSASGVLLGGLRSWYLAPAFLALFAGAAAAAQDLANRCTRPWVVAPMLIGLWLGALWVERAAAPRTPWNPALMDAARTLQLHAAQGDRAGAFNSGILAAFSTTSTTVVNLDGVANHAALETLRARQLEAYVDTCRLRWIVDHHGSVEWYLRHAAPGLRGRLRLTAQVVPPGRPDAWIGVFEIAGHPVVANHGTPWAGNATLPP